MDSPVGDRDFWAVPGRVERLRADWAFGYTQAEIAAALGTTPSAVGGKICRLGLARRLGPHRAGVLRAANGLSPAKPRGNTRARKTAAPLPRVAPSAQKPLYEAPWASAGPSVAELCPPSASPVAFADLGDRSCRWPVGGLFCGAYGYPWCSYHQHAAVRGGSKMETSKWQKNGSPQAAVAGGGGNAPAQTRRGLKRSARTGGWVTIPGRG